MKGLSNCSEFGIIASFFFVGYSSIPALMLLDFLRYGMIPIGPNCRR